MKGEVFKYCYAFTLLLVTIGWAVFSVWVTYRAISLGGAANILAAAGTDFLLGSLTTWDSLVVQHYFRKAKAQE